MHANFELPLSVPKLDVLQLEVFRGGNSLAFDWDKAHSACMCD